MAENKNTQVDLGGIEPITNAVGMLYNIGSGIANQFQNAQNDKWNKAFAREQFDYQKSLNELLMQREDTAVQRRAADLKAAGISKNLAAGSPAQASTMSAGSSGAVANSNKQFQQMQKMDIMNSYAQYKMIMSEKNLKDVQAIIEAKKEGLIDSEVAKNYAQAKLFGAQTKNVNEDTIVKGKLGRNIDMDTNLKGVQIVNTIQDTKLKSQTLRNLMHEEDILITQKESEKWKYFIDRIGGEPQGLLGNVWKFIDRWSTRLQGGTNYEIEQFEKESGDLFGRSTIKKFLNENGINTEEDLYRFVRYYKGLKK